MVALMLQDTVSSKWQERTAEEYISLAVLVAWTCWQLWFRNLIVALYKLHLPVGLAEIQAHTLHSTFLCRGLFRFTEWPCHHGNQAPPSCPPLLALFPSFCSLESIPEMFLRAGRLAAAGWWHSCLQELQMQRVTSRGIRLLFMPQAGGSKQVVKQAASP